jgi:hypothetical protein
MIASENFGAERKRCQACNRSAAENRRGRAVYSALFRLRIARRSFARDKPARYRSPRRNNKTRARLAGLRGAFIVAHAFSQTPFTSARETSRRSLPRRARIVFSRTSSVKTSASDDQRITYGQVARDPGHPRERVRELFDLRGTRGRAPRSFSRSRFLRARRKERKGGRSR